MLKILSSPAAEQSRSFLPDPRQDGVDNVEWLARHLGETHRRESTIVILLGSRGQVPFRLRVAQSHLRHDLTPSYWSHVGLIGSIHPDLAETPLYEISLEPPAGFALPSAWAASGERIAPRA